MQRISRAERRRSNRELAKRPQWETLEEFTRSRIQTWIQDLLEEEVTELLADASRSGGTRWMRRQVIVTDTAKRGGYR
jgi:hypothetical protein